VKVSHAFIYGLGKRMFCDLSRSRETMKAGKKWKNAFDIKLDSPDTLKSDNNDNTMQNIAV